VVVYCNGLDSCKELLYWSRLPEALAGAAFPRSASTSPAPARLCACKACPSIRTARIGRQGGRLAGKQPDVDPKRIGMTGISLGGHFAPRAVAYEPRFASGACWGANHNWREVQDKRMKREGENPVPHYWAHVMWAFGARTMDDFLAKSEAMNLNGHMGGVRCRSWSPMAPRIARSAWPMPTICYDQLVNAPPRKVIFTAARRRGGACRRRQHVLWPRLLADWFAETLGGHTA
jgi:hypothetical protein